MNLQELLDAINEKKAEVKNLVEQGKLEEAKKAKGELINLQEQYNLLKDVVEGEQSSGSAGK